MSLASAIPATQPPAPLCLAHLFKTAFDGGDLKPLRDQILAQSYSDYVDAAAALISLSTIEQLLGDQPSGLARQLEALSLHRLYRSSWPASPSALRVLAFKAAGDVSTNTPIEFLLQGSDVVLYSLYVVPGEPLPEVPDHDIAIVTVGESDRDRPVMRQIEQLIQTWPCPVLNRPDRVLQLSREGMYSLLRDVPGVIMAPTVRLNRADLERLGRGLLASDPFPGETTFPMIARPLGSHAGRGLAKLDTTEAIDAYLAERPDENFFLSPYDEGFAYRHATVLAAMVERFGLEYVGVDCAEMPDGRLIVFEGDLSLVVHDIDRKSVV